MPPARARWGKGEAAGRPLGPAEPRCAHGGEVGAGGRGRAAGLRWGKNAFPSFAFSSRSVFLRRVPARVPTGTGTARRESPELSRDSCGGVPGAGRGALEQGRPGTFPAIFLSLVCLSVCLSVPTEIRKRETGVTFAGRLRVTAVLSRGDGNTRGTEPPPRAGDRRRPGGAGLWVNCGKPHFHAGRCRHPPAGASRDTAALKYLQGPMRWHGWGLCPRHRSCPCPRRCKVVPGSRAR